MCWCSLSVGVSVVVSDTSVYGVVFLSVVLSVVCNVLCVVCSGWFSLLCVNYPILTLDKARIPV